MQKVFISSTFLDLEECRQIARDVCLEMELFPIGMEHFQLSGRNPVYVCNQNLAQTQVYVGLFGLRYGTLDAEHGKSITEIEYDYAEELGLERLCFVAERDEWIAKGIDPHNWGRLEAFKQRVMERQVKFVKTPSDFGQKLAIALSHWKLTQMEKKPEQVTVTLRIPFDEFERRKQEFLLLSASLVGVGFQHIEMVFYTAGSTIVTLEMPFWAANQFYYLANAAPERFGDFGMQEAKKGQAQAMQEQYKNKGHVFLCYSRQDKAYADELEKFLNQQGFSTWRDEHIPLGESWFKAISNAIRESAIFVLVMTREAQESQWVQHEILLARELKKPIMPLLLDDEVFDIFTTTQFDEVRSGQMPPQAFLRSLIHYAPRRPS